MLILVVLIHIFICIVLIVLSVHTVFIYIFVQGYLLVPLSLGVLLSYACYMPDFRIHMCILIIKFNSIQ